MKRGFTLIEILIVIGLLAIIAGIGSNMFFTILKGTSKTKVMTEVKQNGDYVINVMERMIRGGKYIEGAGSYITIENPGGETTFRCYEGQYIALESASLTSDKVTASLCSNFITYNPPVSEGPASVTIKFTLSQLGSPTRPEEKASVNFQTTVTFRNY